MGCLKSDAQPNMTTVSSRDLVFPDKILQRVLGEKSQLPKPLDFSPKTITWPWDFLLIFIAYLILTESNSSVKSFSISAENDFSYWGGMFSDVVICSYNMLTIIKTGCTHTGKYNKKYLNWRGISWRVMANLAICRDHCAMTTSQPTLRKERSLSVICFMACFVENKNNAQMFLRSSPRAWLALRAASRLPPFDRQAQLH